MSMTIRTTVRMKPICVAAAVLVLATACGREARATGIYTNNPGLPPQDAIGGQAAYLTPQQVHEMYSGPGLQIVLSQVQHKGFANIQLKDDPATGTQTESFTSVLTGMVSINGSPNMPFELNGPVVVDTFGKVGHVTGTFATQMTSMDMTGTVGGHSVEVTLDPGTASTGQVTITSTPNGPGAFHIDSFFDVFTDISLDGGPPIAGSGPSIVQLQTVPEPSTWVMLVAAGLMVPAYARWGRRRA